MPNLVITNQQINKEFSIEAHDEQMWIFDLPLVEVGKFIAGNGEKVEFKDEFLGKSAEFNNAQIPNRVPYLILGHIDETAALMLDYVFGDVREFEYRNGTLYAKRVRVYKEKEGQMSSGKYQGVSVSINMDTGEINHVALVGRQAIPSANINNAKIVKFEEYKGGKMAEEVKEPKQKQVELSDETQRLVAEFKALQEKNQQTEAQLAEYAEKTKSLELQAKQAKAESFVEKATMEGLILPSQKQFALNIAQSDLVKDFEEFLKLNKRVDFNKENPFTDFVPNDGEQPKSFELPEEKIKEAVNKVLKRQGGK